MKPDREDGVKGELEKGIRILIAEFSTPGELLKAAERLRDAGYKDFDCHSPFPIHGMDKAMGLRRSPLGWIVGGMALIGGTGGFLIQWWTSAVDYPLIVAGKPLVSFQAYVPVMFGLAVLFASVGSLLGMLILNRLPRLNHAVFESSAFERFSNDRFFITISLPDLLPVIEEVRKLIESLGSSNIEVVKRR